MTQPAPSLRTRLTIAVSGVLAVSLCVFSIGLYTAFSRALSRQFDERLQEDARAIANMVEEREHEPWEFEATGLGDVEAMFGSAYFEVRMDDGSLLVGSSALLAGKPNTNVFTPGIRDTLLPDGRPARAYRAAFSPRLDDEGPKHASGRKVRITVLRATQDIDASLATLRWLLAGSGVSALVLAAFAGAFAIDRGLKPIARLSARIDAIDARRLGEHLPVDELPRELQPAVIKFNALLLRVEESVARERQWNRAVSHELRTPLAGLRSILDVCVTRDRSAPEYRAAIEDALQVVLQLTKLVEQLLLLAKLDARSWHITEDAIDLHELVNECFEPYADKAASRSLQFDNHVARGEPLTSDRDKLRMVVSNLISNAVEYTADAGCIRVSSHAPAGCVLDVSNSGPPIAPAVLERIFDPFVRLEPARSGGGDHCGIGLTLARGLCTALKLAIVAENRADGWVAFTLSRVAQPL